jgi:hypothetical protein
MLVAQYSNIVKLAAGTLSGVIWVIWDSCKYQPPNTSVVTVCKPYAKLILTLTNQAPL